MFLSAVFLLCAFCTVTSVASISPGTCSVPSSQQWLVRGLVTRLENSVGQECSPNPSVLIALNLAEDQDLSVKKQLVQQIQNTAGKEMTSGDVALYVLALQSSCKNPNDVTTLEKKVNLVQVLEEKTKEEIDHFYKAGTPKTTYYQLALDTLALCVEKSPLMENAAVILAKAALAVGFQSGGYFSVGTGAMASLALTCVYEEMIKLREALQDALAKITKQILLQKQSNGILGNIYSTGRAMQALRVASAFYAAGEWNCQETLGAVLEEVYLGAFNNPAAASQILPSLVGKTYLDVRGITCSPGNAPTITVIYTIINNIVGPYFQYEISVQVPKDSVLLTVLEAAQQAKPSEFSFRTKQTSFGIMVVSINGINDSTNQKTYWQFLGDKGPLEIGVDRYKPMDNEKIRAIFTTY